MDYLRATTTLANDFIRCCAATFQMLYLVAKENLKLTFKTAILVSHCCVPCSSLILDSVGTYVPEIGY